MRVIAGTARHLLLSTAEGMDTRPTTDRIKETLFNMLQNELYGCRFLDLFAGSGGIGIEALSRGAAQAVFVEKERRAADCIRRNLAHTGLGDRARLLQTDVFRALDTLSGEGAFDIVFMDPPYRQELEKRVLEQLAASPLADGHTLLIAEISEDTSYDYLDALGYELIKYKKYKTNAHIFMRKH